LIGIKKILKMQKSVHIGSFGDSGVGKTSIIHQYVSNRFLTEHDPTCKKFFKSSGGFF
jgi:GTPase SAR1 family protein